jgi:hypothetical protein
MTPSSAVRLLTTSGYETAETRRESSGGCRLPPLSPDPLPREERELLIDVRPAAVSLEHDLAAIAAKDDLEVAPPDRSGIATAHWTGCRLVLERGRQGFDLDLQTPSFLRHMLHPLLFINPSAGCYLDVE